MSAAIRRGAAAFSLMMILVSSALAQDEAPAVRAAVGVVPPFVMKQGDQLTGFNIDLWNEIATRLKLTTSYQVAPDVDALLSSLRTKSADVIVNGIFYSTERDREFDYSYPIMGACLQVMVRDEGGGQCLLR